MHLAPLTVRGGTLAVLLLGTLVYSVSLRTSSQVSASKVAEGGNELSFPANVTSVTNQRQDGDGWDCLGSFFCRTGEARYIGRILHDFMTPLNSTDVYYGGEQIACALSFCAFLQGNTPSTGLDASVFKPRFWDLIQLGCEGCGSINIARNRDWGILTVNYVSRPHCRGLCPSHSYGEGPGNDTTTPTVLRRST